MIIWIELASVVADLSGVFSQVDFGISYTRQLLEVSFNCVGS
jgi:hypothetical protein